MGAHRVGNVLHRLLAEVGEYRLDLALDGAADGLRHRNAARLGQRLQPCGDVHAVAADGAVGLADDDAQVHADAKAQAPLRRYSIGLRVDRCLDGQCCIHRTGGGLKQRQHRVAGHVDDAAVVGFELGAKYRACHVQRRHRGAVVCE